MKGKGNKAFVVWGEVHEDGSFSVLARVCSLTGSGEEYLPGEGNVLEQADVSTITAKVFDIGADEEATTGTEVTAAPTVTVSTSIFDTLRTVGWPTDDDPHGYNFRHDLGPTYSAEGGEWRLVEYKFTQTDGTIAWLEARVRIREKATS